MTLPDWLKHDEDYHPTRDRDAFLSRSLLRVMAILFSLRAQGQRTSRLPAYVALLLLAAWILFIVLTQTQTMLFAATTIELAVLALFSGAAIRRILGGALAAALFSFLLILPALVLAMGGERVVLLPWKSFLTMAAVMMLAESLMWHDATRALARLHVPETVILLLDTMLRALYLLGEQAGTMLLALKIRSIGHNPQKGRAMGGVLGNLYLRSQKLSQATYEAMSCRGFVGTYGPQFSPQPPSSISRRLGLQPLAVAYADAVGRGEGRLRRGVCEPSNKSDRRTNDMCTLTLDDICFAYDGVPALRHVTLTVARGETVAILGPNGAGKSTLLRLLNGILFSETGRYLFEGTQITAEKMREHRYSKWFHQRVGYVWQDPGAMLFCATVADELAFGPQQMGLAAPFVAERVADALTFFGIEQLKDRAPYTLSGGEKKRVAMAAIFTVNPSVWTFDEPTANLDEDGEAQLRALLQSLQAVGKTLIFSTHDEALAQRFATKLLHVRKDHTVTVEYVKDAAGTP